MLKTQFERKLLTVVCRRIIWKVKKWFTTNQHSSADHWSAILFVWGDRCLQLAYTSTMVSVMIWNMQQILLLTGYGCLWEYESSVTGETASELSRILASRGTILWSINELLSWNSLHFLRSNDNAGSSMCACSKTQSITHCCLCCTATLVRTVLGTQSSEWSPQLLTPSSSES